jgi:hypothetical protein
VEIVVAGAASTNLVGRGGGAEHEALREAPPRERAFPLRNASLQQPRADDDKPQQRRPASASPPTPLHPRLKHTRETQKRERERLVLQGKNRPAVAPWRCAVRLCLVPALFIDTSTGPVAPYAPTGSYRLRNFFLSQGSWAVDGSGRPVQCCGLLLG